MKSVFDPDNWLFRGMSRIADYFLVSCCWLLCSLPVVTVGSASIALYDTVAHCIRSGEGHLFRRFFRTFKNELVRGIGLVILWAVICWILNAGYQSLIQLAEGSEGWAMFSIIYDVALLIPLGCLCWVVAVESRFVRTFGDLHRVAFVFTFAYLPNTVIIEALLLVAVTIVLNFPIFVLFIPGITADLQAIFVEKVFKAYMPEEEE